MFFFSFSFFLGGTERVVQVARGYHGLLSHVSCVVTTVRFTTQLSCSVRTMNNQHSPEADYTNPSICKTCQDKGIHNTSFFLFFTEIQQLHLFVTVKSL